MERKQYYTPRNLCLSCRRVENGVPLALHAVFHANEPHVTATIKERYKSSYYTRSRRRLQYEATDAVLEHFHIEIDRQSRLHFRQFHIGQQLCFVNAKYSFNTLHLDNKLILNE